MSEYPGISRFTNTVAKETGRFDFDFVENLQIVDALLKKHHGFVLTAVDSFMQALTREELEAMGACEKDTVLTICNAHLWSHTSYIIIEKVVDDIYKLVCLEA